MREFVIQASHRPGELTRIGTILGKAGVNLKSVSAMAFGNQALIRIVPDDIEVARGALQENGLKFEENEVVTALLENKAGELADMAEKLSKAGINLHAVYLTGRADDLVELAVISDDPRKAKKLVE